MTNRLYLLTAIMRMRERPGMYIGEPSIRLLDLFLTGYLFAMRDAALELPDGDLLRVFREWLGAKFATTTTRGWSRIIAEVAGSDEAAVPLFYELLEEFLASDAGAKYREAPMR